MRSLSLATAVQFMLAGSVVADATPYDGFVHLADLPNVLFLTGEIQDNASFELRKAMRDNQIDVVVTASPGGNLYEGLQIAAILHDNQIGTYVPASASCESSCANVFLGGRSRLVLGELGVHQFYTGGTAADGEVRRDVATAATQYTAADIIGIMNEFDTPPFVYEKMFGTLDVYYFKPVEKTELNLNIEVESFTAVVASIDEFLVNNPAVLRRPTIAPQEEGMESASLPAVPNPEMPPSGGATEVLADIDFFGMDLSPDGHRNVSISECDAICRSDPSCAAWSYVTQKRWCWPKSGVQNISLSQGTVSRVVNPSAVAMEIFDRPFIEATAKDVVGYDIFPNGLRPMSLQQCRSTCEASSSCRAFSWVAAKEWCFPKYGAELLRDQTGVISGLKLDQ